MKLGFLIIAEQMFGLCLAHPELRSEAQANLALVFKEQGRIQEAIELYTQYMSNEPTHSEAFNFGKILAENQQYDKAILQFTTCIELARENLLAVEP